MTGFFNLTPKQQKKLHRFFSAVAIFSLFLQLGSGIFSFKPVFAEEEVTPTPTPIEETISTPESTDEPTPTAEPTPEIFPEITPTPILTEEITPTPTFKEDVLPAEDEAPPQQTGPPTEEENSSSPTQNDTPSATPVETTLTPTIDVEQPEEKGQLNAIILDNVAASSLELDLATEDVEQSASLVTDKADYAPTDTVLISGSNFNPNETYTLIISSQDEPQVNFEAQVTADENGTFVFAYQLDGNYRPNYKVEAKDKDGKIIASTTFTDTWPTYNVGTYGDNTYSAPEKKAFHPGETVYGKGTRSSAGNIRLIYRDPDNNVVETCDPSGDSIVVYCDYVLPAIAGKWKLQLENYEWGLFDGWHWDKKAEAKFNVVDPTWPDCGFNCTANDVTVGKMELVDGSGNPLTSCTPGSQVNAYLRVTYNNHLIGTLLSSWPMFIKVLP
ncbi:hypothetical protein FJZ41_00070 [Candidatus Shapirobacteria bacterium]|nr:hypothetical protein [Candidatus Shapirobacteria bacterium]